MQIFVDADACPVVGIVEKIAKEHNLPVTLLCDTNHVLSSDYSEMIVVGAGADAVDYKLISICIGAILLYHRIMEWRQWLLEKVHMRFISPGNGIPMIANITDESPQNRVMRENLFLRVAIIPEVKIII